MRRIARIALALGAALLLGACTTLEVSEEDSPAEILKKAAQARDNGLYSQAITNYQRLESLYPYSRQALQAQIMTAYTYYLKGDSLAAVRAADRFLRLHPRNPHVDYALYLKGIAHYQKIGDPDRDPEHARKAAEIFRQLLRQHPDSLYAEDGRLRLRVADRILAGHDLHVARYYFDRRAFVAAASRCRRVLTEHPGTPSVEPALGLMARSYSRLDLDRLAADTLAILAHNFPDSPEIATTRAELEGGAGPSVRPAP